MITSHSWGEVVVRNFFWWVERREPGWTEANVANYVSIAGSVLGVPKARPRAECPRTGDDRPAWRRELRSRMLRSRACTNEVCSCERGLS